MKFSVIDLFLIYRRNLFRYIVKIRPWQIFQLFILFSAMKMPLPKPLSIKLSVFPFVFLFPSPSKKFLRSLSVSDTNF